MKEILIPTDFSEVSYEALELAYLLAHKCGVKLRVAHILDAELLDDDALVLLGKKKLENATLQLEEMISKLKLDHSHIEGTVKIENEVIHGFASHELIEISKRAEILFIVMGTTGTNFTKKIFGSVSTQVALNAYCPVLLIPGSNQVKSIKKVLIATDNASVENHVIDLVVKIAEPENSSVHLVHVFTEGEKIIDIGIPEELVSKYQNISWAETMIFEDDILASLHDYENEQGMDLTVMTTRVQPFWQDIFQHSTTKKAAMETNRPLLVFHDRKI